MNKEIKVLLIDDSIVVRGLIRKILDDDSEITVVGSSPDGEDGLYQYKKHNPDIVILDIEMPKLNGIETLKEIKKINPTAKVIMCSSLTKSGAKETVQALEFGAVDYLTKPSSTQIDRGVPFKEEIISKIKNISKSNSSTKIINKTNTLVEKETGRFSFNTLDMPSNFSSGFPSIMAIGASTGGPMAICEFLKDLDKDINFPVLITQHTPEGFTKYLADMFEKKTGFTIHEAADNQKLETGQVYLAPGGIHIGVSKTIPTRIKFIDTPPQNYCKPSIDVMLESITEVYKAEVLTILLTGMGHDGKSGVETLIKSSKTNIIFAQDEETSVVWGIPGAVAKAGLCHKIGNIEYLSNAVKKICKN